MSHDGSEAGSAYEEQMHNTDRAASHEQSDNEASSPRSDISFAQRGKSGERSPRKRSKSYKQTIVPRKTQYNEAYRTLYNDTVEDISLFNSTRDRVPPSQIGLSIWSSTEKEILFQKVASLGKDNVKALAVAIGSKSEAEVRQFILLLDQGLVEGNVTHALPVMSAVDHPIAFEVSKQSEDALEEFADGLSRYQENSDQKRERKRHLGYWLLTEEIAAEIEGKVGIHLENPEKPDEGKSEKPKEDRPDGQPEEGTSNDNPDDELEVPAAELLNLPNWLRLSQLFMYKSPESEENWTNFITKPNETPSMYHTAFQDFHNLTVSITSRLIQASIFQTMTRLRARDKDQPAALIKSADVIAVSDMLGIKRNRRTFWGSVPRSHGLTVTRRYHDHKEGHTKSGVDLSLEDAEAILGVGVSTETNQKVENKEVVDSIEDEVEGRDEEEDDDDDLIDPDYFYEDSELWSEISDSADGEIVPQHYTIPDDHGSDVSTDEEDPSYRPANDEVVEDNMIRKPRKRGVSAKRALQQAHDTYLEAFDQNISQVEEIRMWDLLNVPPPEGIKDEEVEIPRQPATKRTIELTNWREDIEFEAQWEGRPELVKAQEFVAMQERGERGRKRRRLAYEYLEKEGLVELDRPETNNIRKIPRQEREIQAADNTTLVADAATTAKIKATATLSRSQSPRSVQSKGKKKSSDRRSGSRDSTTSQTPAQDSNPLMMQMAKRLAKEEERNRKRKEREEAQKEEERNRERKENEEAQKALKSTKRATRSSIGKRKSGF